ncbi:NAD-dependent epimerase/dehydratase family protein [Lignipirellula cremea]|uniref:Short chain dehydrogenase n=1 Tax=Lignipirellula cremea TaxID=2528010 RepID=A0A518DT89_9BACT|nr:NAD(P)-dependent oxidoreductase [Lignipirellula cremea]QDU95065.1 short chain dehydrogenase [Lignipirellula cremea]
MNTTNNKQPVVLVTGSSGMLGQNACAALAAQGYLVFGLDVEEPADASDTPPSIEHIPCDLTDDASVQTALSQVRERVGVQIASVVHMAAYYDFSGEDSPLYQKITVEGTDRLLNALEGFQLEQFVFTSTMLVHAPCEVGERITEDDPLLAKWPYPQSKIDTERVIFEQHPQAPSVALRIAGVYTEEGVQPTLVQQIKRIYEKDFQSHFFPGDTAAGQTVVHLEDTIDAIVRCVDRRKSIPPHTAILVGEPNPPSYGQLQEAIGKLIHGKAWSTLYVPPLVAKAGAAVTDALSGGEAFIKPFMVDMADDHYALDISRAKSLLGWEPQHRLLEELPAMVNALQEDPDQWYRQNQLDR